jgi:uncharacterized tellurite resistance protein B-like protein
VWVKGRRGKVSTSKLFPKYSHDYGSRNTSDHTMINAIQKFFKQFIEPGTQQTGGGGGQSLQIATAALLLEMMRMDDHLSDAERGAIVMALRQQFALDPAQLDTLITLAEQESRQANDYYQFTSLINKSCTQEQKIQIVEYLWRVAMADSHLDAHELHLMRKLADLLYIGHADYVAAKQRARESSNLPPSRLNP